VFFASSCENSISVEELHHYRILTGSVLPNVPTRELTPLEHPGLRLRGIAVLYRVHPRPSTTSGSAF